jgi:hypothetical protein
MGMSISFLEIFAPSSSIVVETRIQGSSFLFASLKPIPSPQRHPGSKEKEVYYYPIELYALSYLFLWKGGHVGNQKFFLGDWFRRPVTATIWKL